MSLLPNVTVDSIGLTPGLVDNKERKAQNFLDGIGISVVLKLPVQPFVNSHDAYLLVGVSATGEEVRLGIPQGSPGLYERELNTLFPDNNLRLNIATLLENQCALSDSIKATSDSLSISVGANTWHFNQPFINPESIEEGHKGALGALVTVTSSVAPSLEDGLLIINIEDNGQLIVDLQNPAAFQLTILSTNLDPNVLLEQLVAIEPLSGSIALDIADHYRRAKETQDHPDKFGFDFEVELDEDSARELGEQLGRICTSLASSARGQFESRYGITLEDLGNAVGESLEAEIVEGLVR